MDRPVSLDDILHGVMAEGQEKTASRNYTEEDVTSVQELALLEKAAEDFSETDVLKIAAAARMSGNVMSEVITEKLASVLEPMVYQAVENALYKIAVGDAPAESGAAENVAQNPGEADEDAKKRDMVDGPAAGVDAVLYANRTQGAAASGGAPQTNVGEIPVDEAGNSVDKVSNYRQAMLQQMLAKQAMGSSCDYGPAEDAMGQAMPDQGPSDEEIIQLVQQMMQQGQEVPPELMAEYQQIMSKTGADKTAQVRYLLSQYLPQR